MRHLARPAGSYHRQLSYSPLVLVLVHAHASLSTLGNKFRPSSEKQATRTVLSNDLSLDFSKFGLVSFCLEYVIVGSFMAVFSGFIQANERYE